MPQTDSYSAEGDASSEDIARRLKLDKGLGPSCVCCMKLVAELQPTTPIEAETASQSDLDRSPRA